MYLRFYGLQHYPFSITPDPAFLYLSPQHREALGHLLYGTGEHGGFVQLTGEVGTGKTTLIRALLEQDQPDLDVALCLNPRLTVDEFVAEICDELGAERPRGEAATPKTLVDALNDHLLQNHAAGRRTVLIVDEAQNLSRDVLEELRLLTNLETHTHKLMRIILVGQPELETVLRRPDLRQLAQRITARYHLRALNRNETAAYIRHRLRVASGGDDLFTDVACRAVYACAGGLPRLINTVCERALMGGYSLGRRRVGPQMVKRAAREALPGQGDWRPGSWRTRAVPAAAVLAAVAFGFALHYGLDRFAFTADSSAIQPAAASEESGEAAPATASPDAAKDNNGTESGAGRANSEGAGTGSGGMTRIAAADELQPESATGEASAPGSEPPPESGPDTEETQDKQAAAETEEAQEKQAAPETESNPEPKPLPDGNADINQLLRLWGVFGEPVDAPCRRLSVGDLRCARIDSGFDDLESFNRPALIELDTEDGERRQVLLSSLDEDTATLVFGDGTRRIERQRLSELWTGKARLVWRQPIAVRNVQSGSVGNAVVWVREQLARAENANLDNRAGKPSPVFDEELEERVRRFQRAHNLEVDGIVGPRTILVLNNIAPEPGTPFLERSEDGD